MSAVLRQRQGINRGQKCVPVSVSASVGGWNQRDALAEMAPEDALVLDNWFPGYGSCRTRGGSSAWADTLGGTVKTLAEFNAGSSRKFIAAANGKIWNITASGAGASLATGFTNDVWDWAQFDDASGGARLGLVNGSDAPQICSSVPAVSAMTISGVGLTVANLNGICIHKSRSYFWDDRTQDYWYSSVNALGGVLTKFPQGRVNGTGGNLTAMATWSRDAGSGLADFLAIVMSSGDVLVYSGSDPSSATDWALVGRYSMAPPIGKRCITKLGADLIIGTKAGYISLATVFAQGRLNEDAASVSSKIRGAVLDATGSYSANFGWDMKHYPVGNYLLINVPTSTTAFQQHIMNTETRSWCRFLGQNAQCFGLFSDGLYFGTASGTVLRADSGTSDSGAAIGATAQTAWNFLGDRARAKRVSAMRMSFKHQGSGFSYSAGLGFDFGNVLTTIQQSVTVSGGDTWAVWEAASTWVINWGLESGGINRLSSASGQGLCASMGLNVSQATQRLEWLATTYLVEPARGL